METGLNFGQALEAVKQGKLIAREGWNGKGLFVFMQIPSTIPMEVVPKMQSLPQEVKDEFKRRSEERAVGEKIHLDNIYYSNQFCIVNPNNNINGWIASSSDISSSDWCILQKTN